jgi:hypothetical protein
MRNCSCCNSKNEILIDTIKLSMINDIKLNNKLHIYYCPDCNFYYSDSRNTQEDYNNYYKEFNNYKKGVIYSDKDERCNSYLKDKLQIQFQNVRTIIDYGSGNGKLKDMLSVSDIYEVDEYDIGMEKPNKKYDCLILSHVLEHIYDINKFIETISLNINDNGLLYIEIPNAEYYDKITDLCPLQEINIEHINFFSKYALNKLLIKHNYQAVSIIDDYFMIKDYKYYVIRGIFSKNKQNMSFNKYLCNGTEQISKYSFTNLNKYKNIYVYGCGQFLFKIFDNICNNTNVINVIDDNPCYLNKQISNVDVIDYRKYSEMSNDGDVILLTSLIHDQTLKTKLKRINKKIVILSVDDL